MSGFFYDTRGLLRKIFLDHDNLSLEQYEEISGKFMELVKDIREDEAQVQIEKRTSYLRAVFEFLFNTKELTLREYTDLGEMLDQIWEIALQEICEATATEGTVL